MRRPLATRSVLAVPAAGGRRPQTAGRRAGRDRGPAGRTGRLPDAMAVEPRRRLGRDRAFPRVLVALAMTAVLGAFLGAGPGNLRAQAPPRGPGAPPPPSLAEVPGFVDFRELGVQAPGEVTLRVSLYGPLLRMVAEATRGAEPGFAELVDKLQGIFAQVYEVPANGREAVEQQARQTARVLESRGWQTVVEVREPGGSGDTSYLQVRTDGERILGLAVMFVEPGGSAGFINVVGDITPEEVGRLGRTFDIDALDRFDAEELASPPGDGSEDGEQEHPEEQP